MTDSYSPHQVHLLNETRGSTLEVVVSRMKLRGSSVRFVVVSATVPNIQDVADWVGSPSGDGPATVNEVCGKCSDQRDFLTGQLVRRRVPAVQAVEIRVRPSSAQGHERLCLCKGTRLQVVQRVATALPQQASSCVLRYSQR